MRRYYTRSGFEGCFFGIFGVELVHKVFDRRLGYLKPLLHKASGSELFTNLFPLQGMETRFELGLQGKVVGALQTFSLYKGWKLHPLSLGMRLFPRNLYKPFPFTRDGNKSRKRLCR